MSQSNPTTKGRSPAMAGCRLSAVGLAVALGLCMASGASGASSERDGRGDRPGAIPQAVVSLQADSTVRGPEIRLGDIADIRGRDAALTERLRRIEVGRAPLPGLSRTLDLNYLKARLRLQQVDPESLVLDAPSAVSVTTQSQRVSGADLEAAVRQFILQAREPDAASLSISVTSAPPDLVLAAGSLELKVKGRPARELAGSFSVPVEVWVDGAAVRSVSIPVRVSVLFDVLVAARPIGRHEPLTADLVRVERREVAAGQEPLHELGAIHGQRAMRGILPGQPILAAMLELPPLVRRGEVVLLTIEGRGLRAVAQGEAREEGKAGQVIRVRNLTSGREVYGQVEAERMVRVPF
ncbi:MAG TPA: flagellar basal body P-ring formation chaperone FlgA [Candidatus Acidoferrum sp.]|nr:flagellar basal body P-ring formation chaperone FlgA [Candidatus Acidoferrum sp.]